MKNNIFFEESLFEEGKIAENLKKLGATTIKYNNFSKTVLDLDSKMAQVFERRSGKYITFDIKKECKKLVLELANSLNNLIANKTKILLVGLGNRFVIADSLGENTLSKVTNPIIFKFTPSVKSVTNIDSIVLIKSVVDSIKPTAVIIVDSLATRDISKLASSIQLTDSGIVAGGGVSKSDKLLNSSTLGVPVIAVGVPLIVGIKGDYFCPHQIDIFVQNYSNIIAKSINMLE